MNKDIGTRLFMSAFEKYIEEQNIEITEDNMNDVLQEFITIYNDERMQIMSGKKEASDEEKIADLLDKAGTCEDAKKAKQYVKKALKINPDDVGANLFLIHLENNPVDQIEPLLELCVKEKQRLEYYQKETNEKIDNYYLDIEGRDYLHILFDMCQNYQKCGMFKKALEVAKEAIELDDLDHGAFHNDVISINLYFENYEETEQWLKGYQVPTPASCLFTSINAYKQGDLDKAVDQIEYLCENWPDISRLMCQDRLSEKTLEKMMTSENAMDMHEFMDIIHSCGFLFAENAYIDWMIEKMRQYKKKKTAKRKQQKSLLN